MERNNKKSSRNSKQNNNKKDSRNTCHRQDI